MEPLIGFIAGSGVKGLWSEVKGVSVRGCAGAGSTQARTLTCRSPPLLALHPCLNLYGFWVLSNSDRAPVFLFVLCTRSVWGWLEASSPLPDGALTGCLQS